MVDSISLRCVELLASFQICVNGNKVSLRGVLIKSHDSKEAVNKSDSIYAAPFVFQRAVTSAFGIPQSMLRVMSQSLPK